MTVRMPTLGEIRLVEESERYDAVLTVHARYQPDANGPVFRGSSSTPSRSWLATEFFQVRGRLAAEAMDDLRANVAAHRAATLPYPND